MVHLDLFSGIGGFAYALDQLQGGVEHIFCDNDPFCQQVLKKHWPEATIYGDIRQLITDAESQQAGLAGQSWQDSVSIVTGGFPCQPFSQAGTRDGTEDDRYLWPEMFEAIRFTQPEWVIAENVDGILTWDEGVVFEQVCVDLESEGYEVQPFVIPAAAVGAPHRRDRVWFVAHAESKRGQDGNIQQRRSKSRQKDIVAADPERWRRGTRVSERSGKRPGGRSERRYSWNEDWVALATKLCGLDDGLPVELDGYKLTKSKHREAQIKAYGNAIVPQVALELMRGILL